MKTFNKSFPILLLIFLVPNFAFSAEIYLQTPRESIALHDQFVVDIFINSEESINAIEGQIKLGNSVEVVDIFDGNSIITFWVDKPKLLSSETISFSGITPGGFQGKGLKLFSLVLEAQATGEALLLPANINTLLNDGLGTATTSTIQPLRLSITRGDGTIIKETLTDSDPPENFNPVINNDPNVFEGQYFLVFDTQDKITGIDRFEIREGSWGWFKPATSPYLLENQKLNQSIYIKAIDKAGNERLVKLESINEPSWWEEYGLLAIILLTLVAIIILIKIWKKFSK